MNHVSLAIQKHSLSIPRGAGWTTALIAGAVTLIASGWIGLTGSDDLNYAVAARAWVDQFPLVSDGHWGLRHVIVLPMALLFRVLGASEAMLVAPSFAYLAGLCLLTALCLRRVADPLTGLLAVAVFVTVPLISSGVSVVTTDIPEAFLDIGSLWAFTFATKLRRWWLFLLSGALAGLGFLTRETSVAVLVLYGLAFLAGVGGNRLSYVWIGAGWSAIFGLDWLFLFWGSGDPLWRLHVSLRGVAHDNPAMAGQFEADPGFDRFGSLAAPRWLQPILILFANQNLGPFFWLAVPAALVAWRLERGEQRRLVALFGALALIWFVLTGYVFLGLWVLPRYEITVAAALAVPLGMALARLVRRGRGHRVALALTVLAVSNLALVGAADKQPLFGERALVTLAQRSDAPLLTDPSTYKGASWLLGVNGLGDRVAAGLPQPGGLYVFPSSSRKGLPGDWPWRQPSPDWQEIATVREAPRWPALAVRSLGLDRVLPAALARKLNPVLRWATLYRVPPGPPGAS